MSVEKDSLHGFNMTSTPGIASDLNAMVILVTSNIIQSVTLWARGSWEKGAGENHKLTFVQLRNGQKLSADIRMCIRLEDMVVC
jgi:hypothetical protein